jgi:hypothetical protein
MGLSLRPETGSYGLYDVELMAFCRLKSAAEN